MNLYQSRYIPSSDPWEPYFCGTFFIMDSIPCFLFENNRKVCLLSLTGSAPMSIDVDLINSLPSNWTFFEFENQPFLFVNPNIAIDLRQGKQLAFIPEYLKKIYNSCVIPEMYYETHSFVFDDYCISHKGNCGYRCTKLGGMAWEFTGRAYLYTDICRWNNRIFFGTAGQGGFFYILNIDTGEPIASIRTGGTASIVQKNNLCFVASKGSKRNNSKLLCIDLDDGKIVQELDLYGGVTEDSKLQMIDQQIHAVTFEYRGDRLQNAIWNVVNI